MVGATRPAARRRPYSFLLAVNIRVVPPTRNSDRCSSACVSTRFSSTKVPLVLPKSTSSAVSPFTSTAQCLRETSGSSMAMSAPVRPPTIRGLVKGKTWPLSGPCVTERAMRLSAGSSSAPPFLLTMVASGMGGAAGALAAGAGAAAHAFTGKTVLHLVQRRFSSGRPANCLSSSLYLAWHLGQETIMACSDSPSPEVRHLTTWPLRSKPLKLSFRAERGTCFSILPSGELRGQFLQVGHHQVGDGLRRGGEGGGGAREGVGREAEPGRGGDVVFEPEGGVGHAFGRQAQPLQRLLEGDGRGLVGAGPPGRQQPGGPAPH